MCNAQIITALQQTAGALEAPFTRTLDGHTRLESTPGSSGHGGDTGRGHDDRKIEEERGKQDPETIA